MTTSFIPFSEHVSFMLKGCATGVLSTQLIANLHDKQAMGDKVKICQNSVYLALVSISYVLVIHATRQFESICKLHLELPLMYDF